MDDHDRHRPPKRKRDRKTVYDDSRWRPGKVLNGLLQERRIHKGDM